MHIMSTTEGNCINAIIGGQIQLSLLPPGLVTQQVRAGKLKMIAITGDERLKDFPNVALLREAYPGIKLPGFLGLIAPAGIPRPLLAKINADVVAATQSVDLSEQIASIQTVDEVHAALKRDAKVTPRSTSGLPEASWIVADYLDVVLHVFTPETREYYRLEDLWDDVPKLEAAATA